MLVLEANIDQISQHHHYLVADSQHCSVNRAHSPQVDPSVGLSVAVCILHTAHSVLYIAIKKYSTRTKYNRYIAHCAMHNIISN